MDNKEVLDLIGAIDSYADKKNNQGLKNVLLIALIGIVGSGVATIIGYGWREIITLRDNNDVLKDQVIRLEVKYDMSLKEQNKMVFSMAETLANVCEHREEVKPSPVKPWSDFPEFNPKEKPKNPTAEKFFPKDIEDDKKFKDFHKNFEQRIQEKLPPQQIQQMER